MDDEGLACSGCGETEALATYGWHDGLITLCPACASLPGVAVQAEPVSAR